MAILTKAQRAKAPKALSRAKKGTPSFPIPDKAHARLAIAMASRSANAGNISPAQEAKVKSKARAKLKGN